MNETIRRQDDGGPLGLFRGGVSLGTVPPADPFGCGFLSHGCARSGCAGRRR